MRLIRLIFLGWKVHQLANDYSFTWGPWNENSHQWKNFTYNFKINRTGFGKRLFRPSTKSVSISNTWKLEVGRVLFIRVSSTLLQAYSSIESSWACSNFLIRVSSIPVSLRGGGYGNITFQVEHRVLIRVV